ncbi:MAG: HEAT repeat domain-containing protein [Planctomycetes bacterium]|nr:HEAT repeat domain-containing protein [Planctomycetota bacterium]
MAKALGRIGYFHAAVGLKRLAIREGILDRVRTAAEAGLAACAGREALDKPLSSISYELAEKYYYRAESLLPSADFDTANVWFWQEGMGLRYTPVPREIFCDIYAMRMAKQALKSDRKVWKAVSLWLAAYLNREALLPEGADDPLYEQGAPRANHYALASGPRYLLDVLARGLRDENPAVALGAIEALAQTSTAEILGVEPLVAALEFPDRHVRFLAAVSLGGALPQKSYKGYQMVMPVLKEALRQDGKKRVLMVVADGNRANELSDVLHKMNYDVVSEANPSKAPAAGNATSGIDLVVLSLKPDPVALIATFRRDPTYKSTPVVVVYQSADLRSIAQSDKRVVLTRLHSDAAAIAKAVTAASKLGIGKVLSEAEADKWVIRAAATIRLLGLSRTDVFDITRVTGALCEVTTSPKDELKIAAANALAVIKSPQAQKALTKLACSQDTSDDVRLKAFAALNASLRRFTNLQGDAETAAVLAVVNGDEPMVMRDAAARALGAMNLASEKIHSLILGD